MYKLITKILEKSKETGKDIGVAYDIIVAEEGQSEELERASDFLNEHQTEILKLRKAGRENEIKILSTYASNKEGARKYIFALYESGVIER